MTDRIDLDELDDDDREADRPSDLIWQDDADSSPPITEATDELRTDRRAEEGVDTDTADRGDRLPHVPRPNLGNPAGIPVESGGAGVGDGGSPTDEETSGAVDSDADASGPHGGGADEMTMALTYDAARALRNPRRVVADARRWADWVGLVGRVDAPVLNKFQRDEGVDLDFFNGSASGPGERLAAIDDHSMFYADRMVVVGIEGQDESIATRADWEFVPLSEAAEGADWELASGD